MKKILFFLGVLCLGLGSCAQLDEPLTHDVVESAPLAIDEATASIIAFNAVRGVDKTRSAEIVPEVQYVLRSGKNRSVAGSDTIAYVFNYPNNSGFAIVANTTAIQPLVGYSDNGHIDCEDPFFKDNIGASIEYAIDHSDSSITLPGRGDLVVSYYVMEEMAPQLIVKINQYESPWADRVRTETGQPFPAGCVPVAITSIMTHCRVGQTIQGKYYDFEKIIKSIAIHQGVPGLGVSPYTYEHASALMSELLWVVGREIKANYNVKVDTITGNLSYSTSANSYVAWNKLASWNYDITEIERPTVAQIKTALKTNHLAYVAGPWSNPWASGRHAWVIDGYQDRYYGPIIPGLPTPSGTTYLHMQMGEGNEMDGYFDSILFVNNGSEMKIDECFYVMIEK